MGHGLCISHDNMIAQDDGSGWSPCPFRPCLSSLHSLACLCFRCHFGGLLGGALVAYLLGPHYIQEHTVSPFAGDRSCYEHLEPMTVVFQDSPPWGVLKEGWADADSNAYQHFQDLQADIVSLVQGEASNTTSHPKLLSSISSLLFFMKLYKLDPFEHSGFVVNSDGKLQWGTTVVPLDALLNVVTSQMLCVAIMRCL